MGRAIVVLSIIVLCSFAFVLAQLLLRRGHGSPTTLAAPMMATDEDGTVYAVKAKLERFERRLMDSEKRSGALMQQVSTLETEREQLRGQVEELRSEIRKLRKQLSPAPTRPGPGPDATPPTPDPNAQPPSTIPGTGTGTTPQPPPGTGQ
jgi:septal ring factor EnvC (AmiA/AmiB activator)